VTSKNSIYYEVAFRRRKEIQVVCINQKSRNICINESIGSAVGAMPTSCLPLQAAIRSKCNVNRVWLLLQQTSHASNFAPRLLLRYNVSPASHSADFLSPHRPRAGPETGQDRGRGRRWAVAGVAPWARLERGQCQRWDPGQDRRRGRWRCLWRRRGTIYYFITVAIDDYLKPPLKDI